MSFRLKNKKDKFKGLLNGAFLIASFSLPTIITTKSNATPVRLTPTANLIRSLQRNTSNPNQNRFTNFMAGENILIQNNAGPYGNPKIRTNDTLGYRIKIFNNGTKPILNSDPTKNVYGWLNNPYGDWDTQNQTSSSNGKIFTSIANIPPTSGGKNKPVIQNDGGKFTSQLSMNIGGNKNNPTLPGVTFTLKLTGDKNGGNINGAGSGQTYLSSSTSINKNNFGVSGQASSSISTSTSSSKNIFVGNEKVSNLTNKFENGNKSGMNGQASSSPTKNTTNIKVSNLANKFENGNKSGIGGQSSTSTSSKNNFGIGGQASTLTSNRNVGKLTDEQKNVQFEKFNSGNKNINTGVDVPGMVQDFENYQGSSRKILRNNSTGIGEGKFNQLRSIFENND